MALKVDIDNLQRATEKLIKRLFAEGVVDALADVLDENVIGFSPSGHYYSRGSWEVKRFLQGEYERLAPCSISKIRSRQFVREGQLSIESHIIMTSLQQRKLLLLNITTMYRMVPDGFTINGINMALDYDREKTYELLTESNVSDLEFLASYDSATGLFNREAFCIRAADMMTDYPDKSFDILRINIERFKIINEIFGEQQGDKLLNYLAGFMKSIDMKLCLSARLYADNFVMCFEAREGEAEKLIYTMQIVANSFEISHHTVLTFGLYHVDDMSIPVSTMIERANMALNQVKGNHVTPYCVYDDKMRNQMLLEQMIVNEFDSALEHGGFKLFLQPKYDLRTEQIIGSEALVRWIKEDGSSVVPSLFIPVLERNGSVYAVDRYIWEETCKSLRRWTDSGKLVKPVSVNVSRIDLYDPDLISFLVGLTQKYDIPKNLLELEITESAYTDDPKMIMEVTERLQNEGFVILMDDFGSGYSSLNMLKDIHIDILKLDMGFLRSTDQTGRGGNILSAVVQMAKSLNLHTIAEGVETREQVDFLKSIGCYWVQGYYYSKPIPVEEFEKLI
ncbi:bifunctional diguanylate cyclase/phosphodiesterase [uncultured Anaerovibrio sp.]|uniref:putative bifunctional diguanylate cyclase/phosphodiesterase n=1 Tax=uncultured Anaerovibrio sp. TaxID=361586 RepID=UPI002625B299|nr:GGDEF domain-containing phosphodiesterase [uncultured Anaerovibrio sp.]